MSYIFRAFIYGEESWIFSTLRDFLFKLGMRGTVSTANILEIKASLENDVFPVVFIDHSPGTNEGFFLYESLRAERGLELVPFFFLVGEGERAYFKYGEAFGAKGVIKKPFTPNDVALMMTPLSSLQQLQAHQKSMAISKALAKGESESVLRPLAAMEQSPYYSTGAGIALARIFMRMGKYALTEKKLTDMLRRSPGDFRVLCEVADLFLTCNKYAEALKIFQRFEQLDIRITVKVWEQLELLLRMDDVHGAAELIKRMNKVSSLKEPATAALLRIMTFMGLSDLCPQVAKAYPRLARRYPVTATSSGNNSSGTQGSAADSTKNEEAS